MPGRGYEPSTSLATNFHAKRTKTSKIQDKDFNVPQNKFLMNRLSDRMNESVSIATIWLSCKKKLRLNAKVCALLKCLRLKNVCAQNFDSNWKRGGGSSPALFTYCTKCCQLNLDYHLHALIWWWVFDTAFASMKCPPKALPIAFSLLWNRVVGAKLKTC